MAANTDSLSVLKEIHSTAFVQEMGFFHQMPIRYLSGIVVSLYLGYHLYKKSRIHVAMLRMSPVIFLF